MVFIYKALSLFDGILAFDYFNLYMDYIYSTKKDLDSKIARRLDNIEYVFSMVFLDIYI